VVYLFAIFAFTVFAFLRLLPFCGFCVKYAMLGFGLPELGIRNELSGGNKNEEK